MIIKTLKKHFLFFLLLSFYLLAIGHKIISQPLPFYDWDEAIYMEVGREMLEKKSFIPLWQGKYWLDKPPLVMMAYGLIPKILPFIQPEITARIFNLFLNIVFYVLIYFFILKITKSKLTSFLSILLSSFTPLFIQKTHTVNMDVFLGVGWVGYFLSYPNVFLSTIFLSFAVFSKSLLGFYPIFLMLFYYLFLLSMKKINLKNFLKNIKILTCQLIFFFLWYLAMIIKFGNNFIYQHIIESHFKRVTASIEFHFGERIFYITELIKQFNYFSVFFVLGLFLMLVLFIRKKIDLNQFFYFNVFLPWFLFLNLTKTKIFWYLYPAIPQFAFYIAFFFNYLFNFNFFKKIKKYLIFAFVLIIFYWGVYGHNLILSRFSSFNKFYYLANFAKNNCQNIYFLPEKSHREAIKELEKMNLTITTTKWWGGHPALVYYSNNKIKFVYDEKLFQQMIKNKNRNECLAYLDNDNLIFAPNKVKLIKQFDDILLFK